MDKPEFFGLDETLENDASSPLFQDPSSDIYKAADAMVGQSADRQTLFDVAKAAGQDPLGVAKADVGKNGSDSVFSMLAGEDRMSSTAMESFTQDTGAFPNCFACHNTQDVVAKGVPYEHDTSQKIILKKSLLNVSHILSQFVLDECPDSASAVSMSCPQASGRVRRCRSNVPCRNGAIEGVPSNGGAGNAAAPQARPAPRPPQAKCIEGPRFPWARSRY